MMGGDNTDNAIVSDDPDAMYLSAEEQHAREKLIPVMEIFGPTFQGEGMLCGKQTYFIRFGLCDYKCVMCDSMHAVDPIQVKANAMWLKQEDIFDAFMRTLSKDPANQNPAPWITFTGGNPCIHNLEYLVRLFQEQGFLINVENQGSITPEWLDLVDLVTISPKSPGMGERFDPEKFGDMLEYLSTSIRSPIGGTSLCVKVVVFAARDLEFADMVFDIVRAYEIDESSLFLSLGNPFPPQHENLDRLKRQTGDVNTLDNEIKVRLLDEFRSLCEDILGDKRFRYVTFLPQLHVLTWANKQLV